MKVVIKSNSSHERVYENLDIRSALKAARLYGRCEGGEYVQVTTNKGKLIDAARWTPENGGEYYRVCI